MLYIEFRVVKYQVGDILVEDKHSLEIDCSNSSDVVSS